MTRLPLLIALALLTGCSLSRPSPDKSYYTLEATAAEAATPSQEKMLLRVPRASVAPPFSSRSLQYRVAPNEYQPDYYNNWADDPGRLVAAAARQVLSASGRFTVLPADSTASGAATLELEITTLHVDVSGGAPSGDSPSGGAPSGGAPSGDSPSVAVALRATLVDADGAVVMSRSFEHAEAIESPDAPTAVEAMRHSIELILDGLTDDLGAGPG